MNDDDLAPPLVPPDRYDDAYFRTRCAGSAEWEASGGTEVAGIYPGSILKAGLQPGEVVVDIGTGRGDLLVAAIRHGASRAIGVEYAPAAVELARKTIAVNGMEDRAEVLLADARRVPLDDGLCDLVTMLDVAEHLSPVELAGSLNEAYRILRPGGRVLVHTAPSRTVYEVTYRWQRALSRTRRRTWPEDPRNEDERLMHVNEQSVTSLGRAVRAAGFRPSKASLGLWVYTDFVPDERARRLYHRLAKVPGLARLGVGDIWGEGRKPVRR